MLLACFERHPLRDRFRSSPASVKWSSVLTVGKGLPGREKYVSRAAQRQTRGPELEPKVEMEENGRTHAGLPALG